MNEQIIGLHHLVSNNFKGVCKLKFLCFQALLLFFNELVKSIEFLLYRSESGCVNFLEFFVYSSLSFLELLDLFEDFLALATASIHESISSSSPIESLNTWLNGAIQLIEVLFE